MRIVDRKLTVTDIDALGADNILPLQHAAFSTAYKIVFPPYLSM